MVSIDIPGYGLLELEHIVLDYNGTMAVDGRLEHGVAEALNALADQMEVHVVTADTFGLAGPQLSEVKCMLTVLGKERQSEGKLDYVQSLGPERTVAVGNGRNDQLMLKAARLGICVVLDEGACVETLLSADVVCSDILSALGLLLHPLRLTATLRS